MCTNLNSFSKLNSLLLYRNILDDQIVKKLSKLISSLNKNNNTDTKTLKNNYYELIADLIKIAEQENFAGDIWKEYLLKLIITDQNIFSLRCEQDAKNIGDSLYQAAIHDFKILQQIYQFKLQNLAQQIELKNLNFINNFLPSKRSKNKETPARNFKKIIDAFNNHQPTTTLTKSLMEYYQDHGVGKLGIYKAFRWKDNQLIGIKDPDSISFDNLVGYENQQKKLIQNTEAFLNDKAANNVLLFGDSGTGKSSSVKALLNQYSEAGLRLIELNKDQMKELPKILENLKKRGLHFIIFMDDLSFEDFETEYKYMKAIIEGGVEVKPDNVLFYATSNRRHLIKEKWSDRDQESGEVHLSDAIQEKLSLSSRFGLTIFYESPNQKDYLTIVKELAKQNKLTIGEEELKTKAIQWEMWHNGRSGRTAQQFINYLLGQKA
ncbi:ATP-binding protein [Orenia marismortui]|uniref:ATP-binding protein n=1 Tax=Orenia marismortui TaxID=46469 RepID=UPI0004754E9D|nr:ATP-binding protein [Orenia marismortui]